MITNDAQLAQILEQMGRMHRGLSTLLIEVLPQNRQQFALMAEGPLDELRRLEHEVRVYLEIIDEESGRPISEITASANAA